MDGLLEFLHMGGYGNYVWSAFAISIVTLGLNFALPLFYERKTLSEIKKKLHRENYKNESTSS